MRYLTPKPASVRWYADQAAQIDRLERLTGRSANDLVREAFDLGLRRLLARALSQRGRKPRRKQVVS